MAGRKTRGRDAETAASCEGALRRRPHAATHRAARRMIRMRCMGMEIIYTQR
jgi:hypothetical protein